LLALLFSTAPASAQSFDQFLVFGPSNLDSGYFKLTGGDLHFVNARANGAAMTPSGGIMVTDVLSARFGLTDISKGVSAGGTNYAVSGAKITAANSLTPAFPSAALTPSITQQMTNYLASTGGVANPNALYIISAGSNDVPGNTQAYLAQQAAIFTNSVAQLQAAGARYILIPNTNRNFLSTEIYKDLTAAGVRSHIDGFGNASTGNFAVSMFAALQWLWRIWIVLRSLHNAAGAERGVSEFAERFRNEPFRRRHPFRASGPEDPG
jgi:outer membrane lipase/esterase